MKVSRKQVEENRERILDVASEVFRERGIHGIGLSDLMKTAGLTHGAFYGHFQSKEDLVAQACCQAVSQMQESWSKLAASSVRPPVESLAQAYRAGKQLDHPGQGCVFATLGAEIAREGPIVRRSVTGALRGFVDFLSGIMPGRSQAARRKKALAAYASMVGGLVLARAVDDAAFSHEILHAVAASLQSADN